jgi:D-alanyl-D-alanine carboxypeptidase
MIRRARPSVHLFFAAGVLAACAPARPPAPATPAPAEAAPARPAAAAPATAATAATAAARTPTPHAAPVPPQASALGAALDSIMRASYPADQPGAAALVVRHGEVLLRGGYGMADLELGVAMEPDHVFRIGSITKQFTGVATLMLAAEGKLSLDDPITRHLPDYPTGGRTVTVRHLLGHTSGVHSYTAMATWASTWRTDLTLPQLIAVFRDQPFDFEPGEQWSYSNSGYVLLGAIIERASGMGYADFIRTRVFEPLGMSGSSYGDARRIIPNRIPGYSRDGDGWTNAEYLSMTHPYAAGSLLSTVDDMARWDAAITRGELLDAAGWRQAFTPAALNDGRSTRYAAGWQLGRLGEYETIEHGGGIHGFSTNAIRVPEAGLFVVVFANADGPVSSPGQVALRLADRALGGVMDVPAIAMDTARLSEYVAVYRIDPQATRTITMDDGKLHSQRSGGNPLELRPIGEDRFLIVDTGGQLRFERQGGRITGMVLEPRSGMGDRAVRTDEAPEPPRRAITLPSESYAAFPGTYRLAPGFDIVITRDGDQLHARPTGQQRLAIMPESPTRFFLVGVDAVLEFELEGGRATAVVLHQGGRALRAARVD